MTNTLPMTAVSAPISSALPQATVTVPIEKISPEDKVLLDNFKVQKELATEKAKAAIAQAQTSELMYSNALLQLALKYHLHEGDQLNENGEIIRQVSGAINGS